MYHLLDKLYILYRKIVEFLIRFLDIWDVNIEKNIQKTGGNLQKI